jgi:hypothetical protein
MLLREFARMSKEYGFTVIDASRPVKRVASALRRSISRLIQDTSIRGAADEKESAKERPEKLKSAAAVSKAAFKSEA